MAKSALRVWRMRVRFVFCLPAVLQELDSQPRHAGVRLSLARLRCPISSSVCFIAAMGVGGGDMAPRFIHSSVSPLSTLSFSCFCLFRCLFFFSPFF